MQQHKGFPWPNRQLLSGRSLVRMTHQRVVVCCTEQASMGIDRRILFGVRLQWQLQICMLEIQLWKGLSSCQCSKQFIHSWEGIGVKSRGLVHCQTIVSIDAYRTITFNNCYDGCCPFGWLHGFDYSLFLQSIQLCLHFVFESKRNWSGFAKMGLGLRVYINSSFHALNLPQLIFKYLCIPL